LVVINVSKQEVVESAYADGSPLSNLIERRQSDAIEKSAEIPETQKEQLIQARVGQARFRSDLKQAQHACRVTGISAPEHLRASHIKPWKSCTNAERLDPSNGLLFAPHIDHLFDRGFISFSDCGDLIVSSALSAGLLEQFHLTSDLNVGPFNDEQSRY